MQDWIIGVAQTNNARQFWDRVKRRLKKAKIDLSTWCLQIPYVVPDGRKFKMDHATAEGLYIITQRMDAETGLRDRILRFLAQAGVIVDEARIDPDSLLAQVVGTNPDRAIEAVIEYFRKRGDSDEWIACRLLGIPTRKLFVGEYAQSLGTHHECAAARSLGTRYGNAENADGTQKE